MPHIKNLFNFGNQLLLVWNIQYILRSKKIIRKTAERVLEAAREQGAVAVVLGLPVNMNGTEGPKAARIRELAALIERELPVYLMDERMTTMSAARYLNETNTRGKKRKGVIDTLSAQIILQNALDRLR